MHETLRSTIGRRLLARRTCERGVALVSTLTVVVILGIIVTVVVARGPSGPTATGVGGSGGTTTTTSVKTIGNDATASAVLEGGPERELDASRPSPGGAMTGGTDQCPRSSL